jgi:hypothetical protein
MICPVAAMRQGNFYFAAGDKSVIALRKSNHSRSRHIER